VQRSVFFPDARRPGGNRESIGMADIGFGFASHILCIRMVLLDHLNGFAFTDSERLR
jgi:hypothetical protein